MKADPKNVRVCLVAIPEVMASTLMGLYDVLNSFNLLGTYSDGLAGRAHFKAEIGPAARCSDLFDELSCVLTRGWDYVSIQR